MNLKMTDEEGARKYLKTLATIVDGAVAGKESAVDCWKVMRKPLLEMRSATLDELAVFQEAWDKFCVSPEGDFTVNLNEVH